MTEPPVEDRHYIPFVIYRDTTEELAIVDAVENHIFSLFMHQPNYIADESGALIRIVDSYQVYDFSYEDVSSSK